MKTQSIMKAVCRMLAICGVLLAVCANGMAQEASKFLVLPFKIHADRDLSYLQQGIMDMLVTRLSSQKSEAVPGPQPTWDAVAAQPGILSEGQAAAQGTKHGADYVVYGSLTLIGDNVSTQAQCLEVRKKTLPVHFSQAGKTTGDVITHVHQFAAAVREKVLGEKPAAAEVAASGAGALPDSRRHPEALWQESGGGAGFGLPGIVRPQAGDASGQFTVWRSPELEEDSIGIAAADIDGDRRIELVTISEKTLSFWRLDAGRLIKIYESVVDRAARLLAVDAADINGNGKAEVFVTAIYPDSHRLCSRVAEWSGASLDWIMASTPMYFRVLPGPGGKPELFGQTWGGDAPFSSSVYRMAWQAGEYTRTDREDLPKNVNIFSFSKGDIKGDGTRQTVILSSRATLQVQNTDGTTAWTGADAYSGSGVFVEFPSEEFEVDPRQGALGRYYLPQRVHVTDLDGDGKNEVILSDNLDRTGRALPRTRMFKDGRVRCFSWTELGLSEQWQTQALAGHISDTALADLDNDGVRELVVAVIPPMSFSLSQPKSYIVMWRPPKK